MPGQSHKPPSRLIEEALHIPTREEEEEHAAQERAATKIQRAWRTKKHAGLLNTDFLWSDVLLHARFQVGRDAANGQRNSPKDRWKRAVFLLNRLEDGNQMLATTGVENEDAARKHLETQHWLELIDGKHRYGSNLKFYHRKWDDADTNENFFHWLDRGGGKNLSLPECPREQLEKERISYLSAEQRLNYMVQIDSEGKLRWARNGDLVDTTAGKWKDAGDGKGIVPLSYPETAAPRRRTSFVTPSPRSSSSGFANQVESAMHYYDGGKAPHNRFKRLIWRNFTLRGLLDRLLRKTLRRNTWIYVSDKNFNIFVGIKKPGTFQHSSFLAGGLVTSAGLISIKDGMIHTLSPLSGHYRTEIHHFRRFLKVLDERGVDMSKVKVSKAEAALWGIEHLNKFKKKQAALVKEGKEAVGDAANETVQAIANPADTAHTWKNVILEGRKRNAESDHEQPRS